MIFWRATGPTRLGLRSSRRICRTLSKRFLEHLRSFSQHTASRLEHSRMPLHNFFSTGTFTFVSSAQLLLDWNIHVRFVGIPLLDWNIQDLIISIPLLDWNIRDHWVSIPLLDWNVSRSSHQHTAFRLEPSPEFGQHTASRQIRTYAHIHITYTRWCKRPDNSRSTRAHTHTHIHTHTRTYSVRLQTANKK